MTARTVTAACRSRSRTSLACVGMGMEFVTAGGTSGTMAADPPAMSGPSQMSGDHRSDDHGYRSLDARDNVAKSVSTRG